MTPRRGALLCVTLLCLFVFVFLFLFSLRCCSRDLHVVSMRLRRRFPFWLRPPKGRSLPPASPSSSPPTSFFFLSCCCCCCVLGERAWVSVCSSPLVFFFFLCYSFRRVSGCLRTSAASLLVYQGSTSPLSCLCGAVLECAESTLLFRVLSPPLSERLAYASGLALGRPAPPLPRRYLFLVGDVAG